MRLVMSSYYVRRYAVYGHVKAHRILSREISHSKYLNQSRASVCQPFNIGVESIDWRGVHRYQSRIVASCNSSVRVKGRRNSRLGEDGRGG